MEVRLICYPLPRSLNLQVLQNTLRERATESKTGDSTPYLVVLNNIELSARYIEKLKDAIESEVETVFQEHPKALDKVRQQMLPFELTDTIGQNLFTRSDINVKQLHQNSPRNTL